MVPQLADFANEQLELCIGIFILLLYVCIIIVVIIYTWT